MSWRTLSRAERDAAYNNSAAVADSASLSRKRNENAALFRAAHAGHLDLAYAGGERTKWDIFPAADSAAPCLVFIHGGYWQWNRREDFCGLAAGMVAAGWSVALPGYTLAPQALLTEIVAELRLSLDWLTEHGAAHGVAGKVVISGWSAGGHLAALMLDHPRVYAGMAISGVFELGPLRDTYLNENLRLTDAEIQSLSPLRLPVVHKPLCITYGSRELAALVNDARDLHARRSGAHAPGALLPIAEADHFTILDELLPGGALVRAAQDLAR